MQEAWVGVGLPRTRAWGLRGHLSFNPRLQESLSTIQADNLALGEKLQILVRPSAQDPLPFPCLIPASQPSSYAGEPRAGLPGQLPTSGPCNPLF